MNEEDEYKLYRYVKKKRMIFLSTPFSREAANRLIRFGVKAFKIGSGEMNNLPMLEYISSKKIPVILSSGMSSLEELDDAVSIFKKSKSNFMIMQCTSEYPCKPENVGLNVISILKDKYNIDVGFSDHTIGFSAPFAAAAAEPPKIGSSPMIPLVKVIEPFSVR